MAEESKAFHEETPLLGIEVPIDAETGSSAIPQGDADESAFKSSERTTASRVSPPTVDSARHTGRFLLLVVALLYGSLSVSLRMVYERPGPPSASILSATRGWMTVLCLWPLIVCKQCCFRRGGPMDPPAYSNASFYLFCLELALFNFGTQGLLNIGLLTTESARSAFFTQLSVVITPILAATIGLCTRKRVLVGFRVWVACFLALFGLYVLSSSDSDESNSRSSAVSSEAFSWTYESISAMTNKLVSSLSFGDWCCLGSAFCWSYYIYRLSDWGDRYDEAQTMFVKNIFMAIMYTIWTVVSYIVTTFNAAAAASEVAEVLMDGNSTLTDDYVDETLDDSFYLWEGWRDPIALGILFYTALSSGAISDILQQQAQAKVPAAESNVLLSLEPVFAAILAVFLLQEIPSIRECLGGLCIVVASILAST